MARNEALHAGLEQTAHTLLELMEQQRDSQGSALVSERSRLEFDKNSATGLRLTNEKIPASTARNTQQTQTRNKLQREDPHGFG